jgi:hypothetical protein
MIKAYVLVEDMADVQTVLAIVPDELLEATPVMAAVDRAGLRHAASLLAATRGKPVAK